MSTTTIARTTDSLNETINWSKCMAEGSLLPRQYQKNPANLMYAAEYADALGISRIHVLTSIAVINGKPTATADLMSAMVRARGHRLRVTGDDTYAEAVLIRLDDPDFEFTARWDVAKARKAALWGNKGPWTNYPAAMLRARAISEVVRMGATDVMAGAIYTPEELGADVDDEGNPIAIQQTATRQSAPQANPQQAQQRTTTANAAINNIANRTPQQSAQGSEATHPTTDTTQVPQGPQGTAQRAMELDHEGFPTPIITGNTDDDQRLHNLIEDIRILPDNDSLKATHQEYYATFTGEHAAALIQALNARLYQLETSKEAQA